MTRTPSILAGTYRRIKEILSVKNYRIFLRVLVSGTLMIWLLTKVDIHQVAGRWIEVNWLLLVPSVFSISFISVILRSLRVKKLLSHFDMAVPVWWLCLVHMKGHFLKTFLPGGISSDIYRGFVIAKRTGQAYESISTILLEKVFGVGALLLLSVLGLTYGTYFVDHTTFRVLASPVLLVSGVFLAAIIALVIIVRLDLLDRFRLNSKFGTRLQELVRQFSILSSRGSAVLTVLLLSLLIQIGVVGWYFAASRAVGLDLSIIAFMVTIPLVELLLMLPISIGGIGVREGAFVVLLAPFGLAMEDAVSFSLLSLMMLTIIRVSFGVAFLFELDPATPFTKTEALKDR